MVTQLEYNSDKNCINVARWNSSVEPDYMALNGGAWEFYYPNGDLCYYTGTYWTWVPTFQCDPDKEYEMGPVIYGTECRYSTTIYTKYACDQNKNSSTTTTTSEPNKQCIFESADGNHMLNLESVRGELLVARDSNETLNQYYTYTPCKNGNKCQYGNMGMAFVLDENFDCIEYIAKWEDGINTPMYIDGISSWQFTYTNGLQCGDGQDVFTVDWICNETASYPKISEATQKSECVYEMVVESMLACG